MEWIYGQWGDQVYESGFLSEKERKSALDDWLDKEEIDRKTADRKKLLDKKFWETKRDLFAAAEALHGHLGEDLSQDFNLFEADAKAANKSLGLKLSAAQLKTILEAVSWRDPDAVPIKVKDGYEPDSEPRDTENVPMTHLGKGGTLEKSITAYFDHGGNRWFLWALCTAIPERVSRTQTRKRWI